MNVLLTGGTGYIGSHTATALLEAGLNVVLFDNLSNSKIDVLDRLKKITSKDFSFIEGDIRDKSVLSSTLKNYQIDAVIHFAGLKSVSESALDPLLYFENNVGGTLSLLQAMQKNKVKTLVFSSSATIYGEPKYLPIDESHPTTAVNPYGRTKLHIEEILKDVCLSDNGLAVACLRYFNPVGAHETGFIGEDPNGQPNNLMPYIANVAYELTAKLPVYGNDYPTYDGTGVRDFIHVMDLAEGHVAALNYLNTHLGWVAVNLGTGKGTSVLDLVNSFSDVSGKEIPLEIHPRRDGDVACSYTSVILAKELFNWRATRAINEMCHTSWIAKQNLEKARNIK